MKLFNVVLLELLALLLVSLPLFVDVPDETYGGAYFRTRSETLQNHLFLGIVVCFLLNLELAVS